MITSALFPTYMRSRLEPGLCEVRQQQESDKSRAHTPSEFSSAHMATCGDSFYLDVYGVTWDGLDTFDGCYSDTGGTLYDLPVYFRGGEEIDGETAVRVSNNYGQGTTVSSGSGIWNANFP